MNKDRESQATQRRERRIDEALKETFPASDTPSFVGGGAPTEDKPNVKNSRARAAEIASEVIDENTDQSASSDEQKSRKRTLLQGPEEFRNFRRDRRAKGR